MYAHPSGWTNSTKFGQDCAKLETRFWAHITRREKKSKSDLASSTLVGKKLTVDRWWYGKSFCGYSASAKALPCM